MLMVAAAKAMRKNEIRAAAEYYSKLKPKNIIKVVESATVPDTYIARTYFTKRANGRTQPLGQRIIEIPDNVEQFELRDARATFTAYVPLGSIAKGEALVRTGGSGTGAPCATCHGPGLKGSGPFPAIAGRSPSYILRQLYDFQHGDRNGPNSALMKSIVQKLSLADMIFLAAYISSLRP